MADNTAVLDRPSGPAIAAALTQVLASLESSRVVHNPELGLTQDMGRRPAGLASVDAGQLNSVMASLKGAVRGGDGASLANPTPQQGASLDAAGSWQNYVRGNGPAPSSLPGKGGGGGRGGI